MASRAAKLSSGHGVNEFETTHEIPDEPVMELDKREFSGPNLLDMSEKRAAAQMLKDWTRSRKRVHRFIEQWKVNQARSQGFTGVKLVKTQDEASFFVPLGAVPSMTSMNKALRLRRRLTAALWVDPPAPEVQPSKDTDEARDTAEFSTRALMVLSGAANTRYLQRAVQAWDRAHDYGSGFIHFWVDSHLGGRRRKTVQVRPQLIGEEAPPTTLEEGLRDPRTGLDWIAETVERFIKEDGQTLTDDPAEAAEQWIPALDLEILTGKNVRMHPYTALDIWDAEGVSIAVMMPLSELERMFPDEIDALDEDELAKMVRQRPSHFKELLRVGEKDSVGSERVSPDSLVFTLMRYQRQSARYPNGAYLMAAGLDTMLFRDDWYDHENDQPLDIPLTQFKQFDDEDNPYGKGTMEFLGPGNEIRASVLGTMIEYLQKFRTRKTFVPFFSTLQAKQLQSPTKTVIPIPPGSQPYFEDVPELPPIVEKMFAFTTTDLDDESGLQEVGQALTPTSVTSGKQQQGILNQVRVGLSQLKHNAEQGTVRGWQIMLQLSRAFFDVEQRTSWVGEDGAYKERHWTGADLSDSRDVQMAQGSFTMMDPEAKALLAAQWTQMGFISQQAAARSVNGNIGPMLGLADDPHRQRVKRQIANWEKGPPEGWDEMRQQALAEHAEQVQQAQAQLEEQTAQAQELGPQEGEQPELQGQLAQLQQTVDSPPPPDETLVEIFTPLPIDEEPENAALRTWELGLSVAGSKFAQHPPAWREGLAGEYMRMRQAAGIVTLAEQQAAAEAAQQSQMDLQSQMDAADIQEAQIKAGAEVKKVKITQEGSMQKEMLKAGIPLGSQLPPTVAPPAIDPPGIDTEEVGQSF